MTAYPVRSLPFRLGAVIVALLLAAGMVALSAQSAAAHDQLIETDPADGATVDVLPQQISLAFSAVPIDETGGTVVQVTDAAGTVLNDGDTMQSDNVITQQLVPGATGVITVDWRIVSSDGHPVSGQFSFTVTGAGTATASATPTASAAASESASSTASPAASTPAGDDGGAGALPWVIGGLVLLGAVVVIVLLGARAGQQRRQNEERTAGRSDSAGR